MITREADYAIRAMLCLALHQDVHVISTAAMSEEMDIPYRFLRRILLRLANAGLVASTRGKQGGISLTRPPATCSLLEVLRAVDPGTIALNACMISDAACDRALTCVVHTELARLQSTLEQQLAGITLATLVERERAREQERTQGTKTTKTTIVC